MRKILLFVLFAAFLAQTNTVEAVTADPKSGEFIQPNGEKVTVQKFGDEHFHWTETVDGYTLMFNKDGFYEYAKMDNKGDLVPSGIVAKNLNSRSADDVSFLNSIDKGLFFSASQINIMKQIRSIRANESKNQKAFPTTGSRQLVCVLIGYTDLAFTKTQAEFNSLFNQVNYSADGATGSVHDFFDESSYTQLNLSVTVAGPYTASNNMAYYGGNDASGYDLRPRELVTEAINLADPTVNFANFDNDGDGDVDGVYIIYAGFGEENSGVSADAIWAHAWSLSSPVTLDGVDVQRYSCSSELRGSSGTGISRIGVICHEFGHVLGAPDFYDTDYSGSGGDFPGTGLWDLQASGSWNNSGATPAHPNPYTKIYYYNWATSTLISSGQSVTMNNSAQNSGSFYEYNTSTAGETFILENRQQVGFDANVPGHGLLIFHADGNWIATYDPVNDINISSHQGLYPVCASASSDPGSTPASFGSINSGGCPYPGTSSVTSFTDATIPSSSDWAGNPTNKPITNIVESGGVITFDFMGGDTGNPGSFTATASSSTQIDLTWTLNTNSDPVLVAWSSTGTFGTPVDGVTYSAGNSIPGGGTVLQYSTGTSYPHASLSANTTYYYKAWSYDGATYTSGTTTNATTLCGVITSFPFQEGFEGGVVPPDCWASYRGTNNVGTAQDWTISTTAYSGTYSAYVRYENVAAGLAQDWLVTPAIELPVGSATLSFYARDSYSSDWGTAYYIKVSTSSQTDHASFVDVATYAETDFSSTTFQNYTVDLSGYGGQTVYVAFVMENDDGDNWFIDDVDISVVPDTYNVTFNVDDGANPISGANVTLNGYGTQATDGSGQTIFTNVLVESGIAYTVSATGYGDGTGTVDVVNADVTENVSLSPAYDVTFTVDEGTNPIQGANVTLTGYGTQATDASGQTTFTNVGDATGIAYTVTAANFEDGSGTVDVAGSNVSETVTLLPSYVSIYDIQYTTDPSGDSPYDGIMVETSGIVTAVKSTGFYMQDGTGAWNGILVYTVGAPGVLEGDAASVTGYVDEYFGETEINTPSSVSVSSSGNTLPNAMTMSTTTVNNEQYEGVLVSILDAVVTPNTPDPNVDWMADDGSGSVNLDEVIYDPGYVDGNTYNITGVVRYTWNTFRIQPRSSSDVQVIYTVTFNVSDGANPVAGANVTFADYGTQTTDASGQAVFTQIIPETGLGYLVDATGYDFANGSIDVVDADIVEDITLNVSPYCHAHANIQIPEEYIDIFELGTINNSSTGLGFGGYQDFTSISTDLEPCSTYSLTVTLGNAYVEDQVRIWIDWNQDGDFVDDGELVFESEVGVGPYIGSIEVPITATTGQTRMRVRVWDSSYEVPGVDGGSCGNENYGEVEDYTVNVLPVPPAELTVSQPSFDFGDVEVGYTSSESTYTVYGAYLPNDVVITAPTGFEISVTSGAGFTNSITITPDNGSIPDSTIYARFVPTAEQSYTGNITHVSTGATQQNITVDGYGYYTYTISGNLSYNDEIPTAMDNITMNLLDEYSSLVYITTTDVSGNYSFTGVRNGAYFVTPDLSLPWDEVTAMDITAYKKHIGNIPGFVLNGLALESGDVNSNGTVTGMDLIYIRQRILGDISAFASGDWLHSNNEVLVDAANETVNLQAMVYGDGNASYYTGAKSLSDVEVVYDENIVIPENGQFEIPVKVKAAISELASITMMFDFDIANVEINEIVMAENNADLTYSIGNGIVRMVYSTINPTTYTEGQILFYVKGQVIDDSEDIEIASNTVGEFGDFEDNVITGIALSAPLLTSPTGIGEGSSDYILVYPNPANNYINITNVANAKVEICNVYGSLIVSEVAKKRTHKVDVSSLTTGTYLIKIYKDNKLVMRKFSVTK